MGKRTTLFVSLLRLFCFIWVEGKTSWLERKELHTHKANIICHFPYHSAVLGFMIVKTLLYQDESHKKPCIISLEPSVIDAHWPTPLGDPLQLTPVVPIGFICHSHISFFFPFFFLLLVFVVFSFFYVGHNVLERSSQV